MRGWLTPRLTGLLGGLLVIVVVTALTALGWLRGWQDKGLDFLYRSRPFRPPPQEIVIVAIDDDSLKRLGAWPWRRHLHARLLERLRRARVKAIAFDIVFVEPHDDDDQFAAAAKRAGNVFFASFLTRKQQGVFGGYAPMFVPPPGENSRGTLRGEGVHLPVEPLNQSAAGWGYVNVFPERDGIVRRTPLLVAGQDDNQHAALPLAIAAFVRSTRPQRLAQSVPTNAAGEMLLNFYGGYRSFAYLPYYKVLRGDVPDQLLKDRIVLVGMTATAMTDQWATPLASHCPGVEMNAATVLANLLTADYLRLVPSLWLCALIVACGFTATLFPLCLRTSWSVLATALLGAGVVFASLILFRAFNVHLDFVAPSLAILLCHAVATLNHVRLEELQRVRAEERMAAWQRLSELKSDYVSMVSHELRTPLTSIKGFIATLQRDTRGFFDESAKQRFYSIMAHECDRLLRLINEMLDLARLEAGRKLTVDVREVNVRDALEKALATQQFYGRGQHQFALKVSDATLTARADPDRLEQILLNLLSNAVKYSPDGGTVTVSARADGHFVTVTVSDEGIGIAPEHQSRLFERYQRVVTDKSIKGTGLGLYLTKELVEAQGGEIWVESEPGKGSHFSFTLPRGTVNKAGTN
jgi:signal transduction histidine kinase